MARLKEEWKLLKTIHIDKHITLDGLMKSAEKIAKDSGKSLKDISIEVDADNSKITVLERIRVD